MRGWLGGRFFKTAYAIAWWNMTVGPCENVRAFSRVLEGGDYWGDSRSSSRRPDVYSPDLGRLKEEMAAAHPDHGGSDTAFIAAYERYLAAKYSG